MFEKKFFRTGLIMALVISLLVGFSFSSSAAELEDPSQEQELLEEVEEAVVEDSEEAEEAYNKYEKNAIEAVEKYEKEGRGALDWNLSEAKTKVNPPIVKNKIRDALRESLNRRIDYKYDQEELEKKLDYRPGKEEKQRKNIEAIEEALEDFKKYEDMENYEGLLKEYETRLEEKCAEYGLESLKTRELKAREAVANLGELPEEEAKAAVRKLVEELPKGNATRAELLEKLDKIVSLEAKEAEAKEAVANLGELPKEEAKAAVRELVEKLPEGNATRAELLGELDKIVSLEAKEAEARAAVANLGKLPKDQAKAAVRELVEELPEGNATRAELLGELDKIVSLETKEAEARAAVDGLGELPKDQAKAAVRELVEELPEGNATRAELLEKLDEIVSLEEKEAEEAVKELEANPNPIDKGVVEDLVARLSNEEVREELEARVAALEIEDLSKREARKLEKALEAVKYYEENGRGGANINVTRAKLAVNKLKDSQGKTRLTNRINEQWNREEAAKEAAKAAERKIKAANKAVRKAEVFKFKKNIEAARPLVEELEDEELRAELKTRLDAIVPVEESPFIKSIKEAGKKFVDLKDGTVDIVRMSIDLVRSSKDPNYNGKYILLEKGSQLEVEADTVSYKALLGKEKQDKLEDNTFKIEHSSKHTFYKDGEVVKVVYGYGKLGRFFAGAEFARDVFDRAKEVAGGYKEIIDTFKPVTGAITQLA